MKDMIKKIPDSISKRIQTMPLTRFLILGYSVVILLGTMLLTLPIASRERIFTSLNESLFTAVSSTCVTGLVLSDVYTHWSLFGQLVILCMIQIGGVGFMTITIFILSATKQKIGLKQRFAMQESVGAHQVGGMVKMTKFIFRTSLIVEFLGAFILSFRFCPKLGFFKGVYFAVFHAISAFCNAGLDLMGNFDPGSSMITMKTDIVTNLVLISLIVIGGIGFLVWQDIAEHKHHFKSYKLQTKIVIVTSSFLILLGTLMIMILEYNSAAYEDLNFGQKLLASFFQSVSTRTAGFCTVDLSQMNESGQFAMSMLMLVGGSPGSTAGGIKTTTFAVLIISILSVFRKRKYIESFKRRIEDNAVHNACCVATLYILLAAFSAVIISFIEDVGIMSALFETISAIATVGLSVGITASLSIPSHLIIIALMFIGRIGGLTIILSLNKSIVGTNSQYPVEKISIG